MANFTWTNDAGGDWSDASNWSPLFGAPPGLSDTAIFGSLASSYSVTVTTTEVRLVSRAQAPSVARPWLSDPRRLGMRVKRIVLRGADETREVAIDHPDFARGWWEIEHDGPVMSRWTDGAAVLPLPAMHGFILLEIHLAGAMTYLEDTVLTGGTGRHAA